MFRKSLLAMVALFALAVSACGSQDDQQGAQGDDGGPVQAVATYSILGDMVENVAGDNVELTTVVGPGEDTHTFEASPSDSRALADADLVFENGLEFETWLDDLYESSGSEATRVVVSDGIETIEAGDHGHDHGDHEGHDHGGETHEGHDHEGEGTHEEHGEEGSHDHGSGEEISARLLVADGEEAQVQVVDTGAGETLDTFEVEVPARVYASQDGRYGFAVQTDGNLVNVLDGGVWVEDHGDHMHPYAEDPAMLDLEFDGESPVHFVTHEGQIALFNDGDGTVEVFDEADIEDAGSEIQADTIETGSAHHGVAVPFGEQVIATIPDPEEEEALPIGVAVYGLDGKMLQEYPDCPGLHGEIALEDTVAFGCEDGILFLDRDGDGFSSEKITYPEGTGEEERVGTLLGHEDVPYLVGNIGDDGLMRVDLESRELERITLPEDRGAFELDAETGHAVVLTTDGMLHIVDPESGEPEASADAVEPFSLEGGHGAPLPSIALGHGTAYVSDPSAGEVVEVSLEEMEAVQRFDVEGSPTGLALLGAEAGEAGHDHGGEARGPETETEIELVSNREYAQEEGEDHDHGEEGHDHGEFDPHVWQDPNNAVVMVENVRDALIEADPDNEDAYWQNAEEYISELETLDAEIREQVEAIPEESRKLVTGHQVFAYFAEEYGFEIPGTAISSLTTEAADPSAGEIAELSDQIQEENVPAIFPEMFTTDEQVMEQLANEAGVELAEPLFTGVLAEEGEEGDTYLDMMRYNAETMSGALGGSGGGD